MLVSLFGALPALAEEEEPGSSLALHPFVILVGGFNYDQIVNRPPRLGVAADERESRFSAVALSRFGVEARFGTHVEVRSELEIAAGLHGSSVWEGQAALTVRDQYLRLLFGRLQLDVGRITDPASIDYYSVNVANLLLTDYQLRLPFLASGANRGNGALARLRIVSELRVNVTVNAGNPVSNTGTAVLGGTYPPFTRFYYNIAATVRDSASRFPSDLFYAVLVAPSITWDGRFVRAQVEYQFIHVDVTTADRDNPPLRGHNVRGGVMGLLAGGRVRPFANASYIRNTVIAAMGAIPDTSRLSDELFHGMTAGGGIDVDLGRKVSIGGQYNIVFEQQGRGAVLTSHFGNVGLSWWFLRQVALQLRYSLYIQCQNTGAGCDMLDQQHNYYVTLLGVFGGAPARGAHGF
jgi:hypothetical protein